MSKRRTLFRCVVLSLMGAVAALAVSPISKTTAAAMRAAKQSDEIERRIDALLKQRLKPDALPRVLPNPFVIVSGVVSAQRVEGPDAETPAETSPRNPTDTTVAAQAEEFPAFTSAELLARCASTLKFGGMIQLNDRVQIIINNVPRKEGDIVFVNHGNAQAYLRIVRITPGTVTLRLNDAEQVVKY